MNTFVLTPETASMPVQEFLSRMENGDVTVLDGEGNAVAYLLSPAAREELIYAEAQRDLDLHRDDAQAAVKRRTGVTTAQLLDDARSAEAQGEHP